MLDEKSLENTSYKTILLQIKSNYKKCYQKTKIVENYVQGKCYYTKTTSLGYLGS